jgi:hypothetical protein
MVKILIIGGSTLVENDKISFISALINSENSFLEEWAVIIAIHSFWLLGNVKKRFKETNAEENNKRHRDYFKTKRQYLRIVDGKEEKYIIEKNNIYILAGGNNFNDALTFKLLEENNILYLTTGKSLQETIDLSADENGAIDTTDTWDLEDTTIDFFKLPYFPEIDAVMKEFLANHDRFKDLAGVILGGFGNDGAEGLLEIKRKGYKTAVQDPSECNFSENHNEMPNEALKLARHDIITLQETTRSEEILTFIKWLSKLNKKDKKYILLVLFLFISIALYIFKII